MSPVRGLRGRLQRRVGIAGYPTQPAGAHESSGAGVEHSGAVAEVSATDVNQLVKALESLSANKQISVYELWAGPEIKLADGVTVTVRSKKERRRFVRPVDGEVLEWFRSFQAGDVFYDVGANCGSLTLAAGGMHGERISIVAIEPGYANFDSLARNLSHNSMLGFVIPLQVALLDRTGLEPINYYKSAAAGTSLHSVGRAVDHEDKEFEPVETQVVPAYRLDDLVEVLKLPEPTHVKIDVDGAEGPLLQGATSTLARGNIKELLVEIVDHDREGTRLASVKSLLEIHGYERAETFRHHEEDSASFVADHLFRHSDAPPDRRRGHPND